MSQQQQHFRTNLQVQTPTSPGGFKNYTFDALANLTQKIHEISDFEHKNYFSTTATHFRIKKGTQLDKFPISSEGMRQPEPKFRVIKTAGEGTRNKIRIFKSGFKQKDDINHHHNQQQSQQQSHSDLNFITISKYNSSVMASLANSHTNSQNTNQFYNNNNNNLTQDNNTNKMKIKKRTNSSNNINLKSNNINQRYNQTGNNFFNKKNNNSNSNKNDGFISLNEFENEESIQQQQNHQLFQNLNKQSEIRRAIGSSPNTHNILIQNPTQFYHLKSVGFKNYKYPRPPQADQMYSPDTRHRIPLYLTKDPIRGADSNSIESVCVQKVQQDKFIYQTLTDSIQNSNDFIIPQYSSIQQQQSQNIQQQQNQNQSQQNQQDQQQQYFQPQQQNYIIENRESNSQQGGYRENYNNQLQNPYGMIEKQQDKIKKSTKTIGNKLLFEMNQYKRMVNLHNLELKIEQKNNQIPRNIFSRWKSRDSNPNINNGSQKITNAFVSEQTSPKNNLLRNHNPNLNVVQIDKIEMEYNNNNGNNNQDLGSDRSKMRSSLQAVKLNQQSKSKKLTTIIEMYNKMVRISEKYRQSGMILEGESPTKQNKLKILELADESKAKIFKSVFVQSFDVLCKNKKSVTHRILYALGLDYDKEFSFVSLESIIAFYRILIHRDSAISETIKFLEKFFKERRQELEKDELKKVLKVLCQQVDEKKSEYQKSVYQHLIDKFEEHGVIDLIDDLVNLKMFKNIFITNQLNIYDLIDLICGIKP